MTAEQLVRELVALVWNGGRVDELDRFFADPFDHDGRPDSVAGLRAWHEDDAATWADVHYEIMGLVSDGGQVALRWQATARHVGAWGPVGPTGATVTWAGAHFFTVQDGQIVALWAVADRFGKALQLGVTLSPP